MRNSLLLFVSLGASLWGQANPPAFDVTSVKALGAAQVITSVQPACSDGRFSSASPLVQVIRWAYDLSVPAALLNQQLAKSGANRVYDIQGSTDRVVTEAECRAMLQTLLAERFKFAAHTETKEGVTYDLVIARGGHKLQRVAESDKQPGFSVSVNGKQGQLDPRAPVVRGITMSDFAKYLSGRLTEASSGMPVPVTNKTGLEGLFKITLAYSIPRLAPKQTFSDLELAGAIQQQLGLRLEEKKGPVEVFTIDRIEPPDAN